MNDLSIASSASRDTDTLASLGVAAAAAAIGNGEMSSETYTAALLQRARANSNLNAFITLDESATLAAARASDKARAAGATAPLLGVPLAVKDSYLTRGLRTTLGVGTLPDFVPNEDAGVVKAIRNAGGIVFGKNNLVEMSYGLTGHNGAHGQALNPHNGDHVTGGSSSGAGASVGAHLVPAALGGDTVGSIRVPAALCGVVGFKPGRGRWSGEGVAPISHTLDTTGVLARNVEDCLLLDQVATNDWATLPADGSDLRGIRLAYAPRQHLDRIDPEVETHFRETIRRLRDAGAHVVEVDLGDDFLSIAERSTWSVFFHETMEAVTGFIRRHGIPTSFEAILDGLKPGLKDAWSHVVVPTGAGYVSRGAYETALGIDRPEIERRFDTVFNRVGADALLLPTTPCPAPSIEQQRQFSIAGQQVSDIALARYTVAASIAGLPAVSIPMGWSRNGLPTGLEIEGAYGRDRHLLGIARLVESAIGFVR